MGLYTSIVHPDTGEEIQIKTGGDACDWFHVGDRIPYNHFDLSGCHAGRGDGREVLVVIRDNVVEQVIDVPGHISARAVSSLAGWLFGVGDAPEKLYIEGETQSSVMRRKLRKQRREIYKKSTLRTTMASKLVGNILNSPSLAQQILPVKQEQK